MVLDPRARTSIGVETVSGIITDRAIELLGMLNNAIGASGQLGTQEAEIVFNDGNGNRNETLSNQLIAPSAQDARWAEDERVYYQATNQRVDLIAQELEDSLDRIKSELVGNITGLFNTLAAKDNDASDGKKSINQLEIEVANAATTEALIAAQEALAARATEILTSEEALNEMVNIFFESFQLNIERINSEVFNKLHDFDDNYANGASDIENEKFFYQRSYDMPGDVDGEPKPAVILNTSQEVLDQLILEQKILHEDRFGAGTFTVAMGQQFIRNATETKFFNGDLKLSDDIIALIIADRNLSDDDLLDFDSMEDFIDLISFNQLIEYTGIADRQAAIDSLYKDHIQVATPKYYEDQRTIFDILNGKNNSVNSGNTKDRMFSSVNSQMSNVAQGIEDLMRNGYEKVGSSNLQIAIRQNPFAGIEYLEGQRANLEGVFVELVDEQISVLTARQVTLINNLVSDLINERRAIRNSENVDEAKIEEINAIITKAVAAEEELRNYNANNNTKTKTKLAELFPQVNDIEFDSAEVEYATFTNALDPEAKFTRASKMLYVFEDNESGKKNASFSTRKLPTPAADGTIPEDTMPIPPLLSPSPLSAVIAKIGNTVIEKSQALINGDEIPTTDWMIDNTSTLISINEKLGELGASSAGEAFLNNLRESFKSVIKDFFNASNPLKESQDEIKNNLIKVDTFLGEGFDLTLTGLSTNLTSISNAIANPDNIDIGNNFVNLAGLEPVKEYLTTQIDGLDNINYAQEIDNRQDEIEIINQKERDQTITEEDIARRALLQQEVIGLRRDENNLEAAQELLYGAGGTQANPQAGSVLNIYNSYDQKMNQIINDRGGLNGLDKKDFLAQAEDELGVEFKEAIQEYSDSLTDFGKDVDGNGADIIDTFKASLDQTSLDLDGNGVNDFIDIKNMVTSLTSLSESITNTFGGMDPTEGGIDKQGIRRLILLMFLFSILEAGEWDSRINDANVDRYSLT
jgi:hypothetical protein